MCFPMMELCSEVSKINKRPAATCSCICLVYLDISVKFRQLLDNMFRKLKQFSKSMHYAYAFVSDSVGIVGISLT